MTDRGAEGLYKGVRDRGRKGRDEGNTGTSDVGQKEVIENIWVRPEQSSSSQSLKKKRKKKKKKQAGHGEKMLMFGVRGA